jgi:hypothetical protein
VVHVANVRVAHTGNSDGPHESLTAVFPLNRIILVSGSSYVADGLSSWPIYVPVSSRKCARAGRAGTFGFVEVDGTRSLSVRQLGGFDRLEGWSTIKLLE